MAHLACGPVMLQTGSRHDSDEGCLLSHAGWVTLHAVYAAASRATWELPGQKHVGKYRCRGAVLQARTSVREEPKAREDGELNLAL